MRKSTPFTFVFGYVRKGSSSSPEMEAGNDRLRTTSWLDNCSTTGESWGVLSRVLGFDFANFSVPCFTDVVFAATYSHSVLPTKCLEQFPHRGLTSSHCHSPVSHNPSVATNCRNPTFSLRDLHARQPARDFLCERRFRGSWFARAMMLNIPRVCCHRKLHDEEERLQLGKVRGGNCRCQALFDT